MPKPLTETETNILEEIDAFNRARIRTGTTDYCADAQAKGTEWMCGADIQKILKSLVNRGFLMYAQRKYLHLTDAGRKNIKGNMKLRIIDAQGNEVG